MDAQTGINWAEWWLRAREHLLYGLFGLVFVGAVGALFSWVFYSGLAFVSEIIESDSEFAQILSLVLEWGWQVPYFGLLILTAGWIWVSLPLPKTYRQLEREELEAAAINRLIRG
jgi:H+/Cl- antiporter ClcA